MKSFLLLLPLIGSLVVAQEFQESSCQCPQVKCPSGDAVQLCNCLNGRETLCKERCPDYKPTFIPCPAPAPPPSTTSVSLPRPTYGGPKPPKCDCDPIMCPMIWPQSCYCLNGSRQKCYEKCGGEKPEISVCPPLNGEDSFKTVVVPQKSSSTKTTKPTPKPEPTGTNPVCGGGRGNYKTCEEGFTCIKDPFKSGCGPECDGPGICVKDKLCGGFAGFSCDIKGQICVDDPRDDCDPKKGGADCGGICMWKTDPEV